MSVGSYDDLLDLLRRQGVLHQADGATRSARIPTEINGLQGVQLLRWQDTDGVLAHIQSMAVTIPAERLAAVEQAIARINHALPWPGLDLNHDARLVAYRLVLPMLPGGIDPRAIQAYFRLAVRVAANLTPTLRRVAAGELEPAGAVADVRRELAAVAKPASEPPFAID
jgi:hypothetical protein